MIGAVVAVMREVAVEGYGISGLVESIFGIGKDMSSFVTEPVVHIFLQASKKVLTESAWGKLPNKIRRR